MHNKTIFALAALALFIAAALTGYYGFPLLKKLNYEREKADFVAPGVPKSVLGNFGRQFAGVHSATEPKALPDVPFLTTSGQTVRIADFAGKPTLVNLWARWCSPCVVELPSLQKFAKYYRGRINVVALALEQDVPAKDIEIFLEKRELGAFAGYVDQSGEFARNLGLRGIPTSFLIGSDGRILYRFEGDADWNSPDAKDFFDILLLQKR